MSLADSLKKEKITRKGPGCGICALIKSLPAADSKALIVALDDPTFTAASIHRALKAEGHLASASIVLRHRNKNCVQ